MLRTESRVGSLVQSDLLVVIDRFSIQQTLSDTASGVVIKVVWK